MTHLHDDTEAEFQFRQALSSNAHCIDAQVQLAVLYGRKEGKEAQEEALKWAKGAVAEGAGRDDARVVLATCLTKARRYEDASAHLREAIRINATNAEARLQLAALLHERYVLY